LPLLIYLNGSSLANAADNNVLLVDDSTRSSIGIELITRTWTAPSDSFEVYDWNALRTDIEAIERDWKALDANRAWWNSIEKESQALAAFSNLSIGRLPAPQAMLADWGISVSTHLAGQYAGRRQGEYIQERDRLLVLSSDILIKRLQNENREAFDKLLGAQSDEREIGIASLIASDNQFWDAIDTAQLPHEVRNELERQYVRIVAVRLNRLMSLPATERDNQLSAVQVTQDNYTRLAKGQKIVHELNDATIKELNSIKQTAEDAKLQANVAIELGAINSQEVANTQAIVWGTLSPAQRKEALAAGWFPWLKAEDREELRRSIERDADREQLTHNVQTTARVLLLTAELAEVLGENSEPLRRAASFVSTLGQVFAAVAGTPDYVSAGLGLVSLFSQLQSGQAGRPDPVTVAILQQTREILLQLKALRIDVANQHAEVMRVVARTEALIEQTKALITESTVTAPLGSCRSLVLNLSNADNGNPPNFH